MVFYWPHSFIYTFWNFYLPLDSLPFMAFAFKHKWHYWNLKWKACWMNLYLFPLEYTHTGTCALTEKFPLNEIVLWAFFWDCIVGRVGEVNIKHFIWVQVAMCLLKWLPGTRLPASHRPSVPVLPVNPPAAPYRISHVNGKNLHCFRASLLHS